MDNKFEAYRNFKESGLGKDLLEWMESEYQRRLEEAVKAPQDEAYGILKSAYGILLVKQHIDSVAGKQKQKG
ncbi:MAG TPA: hypothetical protein PKV66_06095 [Candidatus Pelethenecus sp.]|jgi:hypothetical protein|nr:hypothetical protein [Candidatus Pelethenecus sp.]